MPHTGKMRLLGWADSRSARAHLDRSRLATLGVHPVSLLEPGWEWEGGVRSDVRLINSEIGCCVGVRSGLVVVRALFILL